MAREVDSEQQPQFLQATHQPHPQSIPQYQQLNQSSPTSSSPSSPSALPDLLPSSSSDRSSFSTISSRPTSNQIHLPSSSCNESSSFQELTPSTKNASSTVERLSRMAAEQEKQAHYVSRRSPLGPRAEGSPGFEEAENERIERAQAQAERDMYMHMHAHMQRPTPVLVGDRTRAGALVERVEERRKRSEDNDRSNGRNEQQSSERTSSNSGIRPTEEIGNQRNGGLGIISQDEKSQNRSQQEAQLQAAAKYASLASLSSPSILRDATQLQRGDGSPLPSTSSQAHQEEVPRLSTSSAESSAASDVTTPEKYERGMWGRAESSEKQVLESRPSVVTESRIEYPDPEPDTQDLQNLQSIANNSSLNASGLLSRDGRIACQDTQSSTSTPASASSSHTALPARISPTQQVFQLSRPSAFTSSTSCPASPSHTASTSNSAAQTPAAAAPDRDRDPIEEAMEFAMTEDIGNSIPSVSHSPSSSLEPSRPIGMSGASSTLRRPAPSSMSNNQDPSSFSSCSIPHSSPTTSTASGPGGAPTSPTTSTGISLRASLASPDSWRSLLPLHDPYFADPGAEDGTRSTAGSISGNSSASGGHGLGEDRFKKTSRQNSSSAIASSGASALGIAAMNTPSATSLSSQLAQLGVGSYGSNGIGNGPGEPFPSSGGSAAGSTTGANQNNGTAYAYAYGSSSSASQDHIRRLSNTSQASQLSSFSLPGPTQSGMHALGGISSEAWEEMEKKKIRRESWRSFLPEGDPGAGLGVKRDLHTPHRRTNTNSNVSVSSSPSLSLSDSPSQNFNHQNSSPNWNTQSQSQQASPYLGNRGSPYEELHQHQNGNLSSVPSSVSAEAARRHASFSTWESAQREREGVRGLIRRVGQDGNGMPPPQQIARNGNLHSNTSRRTGSMVNNSSFSPFIIPSEGASGMVHSHSQPPYAYPSSSTSTSHTTQTTSYRTLSQQQQQQHHSRTSSATDGLGVRRLPTSAVMGDNEERESWPSSGTSLSSGSMSGHSERSYQTFEDGDHRRASGLRGDLEGWTVGRDGLGSIGLTRNYEAPVSMVHNQDGSVVLTTTTTTTTTTFTRSLVPPQSQSQPQSPGSEHSNPSSPRAQVSKSYSNSGSNALPSSPIAVPQTSSSSASLSSTPLNHQPLERADSPCLVSPLSPPSVPFLDHRQAPASTNLTIETTPARYVLKLRLPNFSINDITLATKHHRTLHIVADNWTEEGGGHVERRVTFGGDALMRQVVAEFDSEILKIIIPRRVVSSSHQGPLTPFVQNPPQQRLEEVTQTQA